MNRSASTNAIKAARKHQTKSQAVRQLLLGAITLAVCAFLYLFISASPSDAPSPIVAAPSRSEQTTPTQARAAYGQLPLSFEANHGQADAPFNFLARGAGYTLALSPTKAVFALVRRSDERSQKSEPSPKHSDNHDTAIREGHNDNTSSAHASEPPTVLRMNLVGANREALVEGLDELEGKVNYLIGSDKSKWRTNVSTFARVRYTEVYPGIDVVYYGNQKRLEYDFVVAPGRDASAINLRFEGADKVEVDAAGDLLLSVGGSSVRQPKPVVYQEVAGTRRIVEGDYALGEGGRVGFNVGEYDKRLPLVIDPTLVYSTYLGGSGGDQGLHIAVDSAGSAYIVGFTGSTNFPTANPIQAANGGVAGGFGDAFVTKLNAAGNALVYSTYLGGSGSEQGRGIAVDSSGNAYVTGVTNSTNFPTANAFDATIGSNGDDAFVTKLNAAGNALVYSTYLGGDDSPEFGQAITVDSAGAAYVTGSTFSNDFPTVNPIQATEGGGSTDAFLSKINAAGSALVYSTYLGGNDNDSGEGIKVDAAGNCYLGGDTFSTNFPTASPIQAVNGGNGDTFVLKVNAAGNALVYSTYLGGSLRDACEDLAIDSAGNVYTTGDTESNNFPTANAFQGTNGGTVLLQDAFVTKLNAAGNALVFSTYLGGTGGEIGFGIAVDSSGNVYVAGATGSNTSFPTANAIQCARAGGADVTMTKFNPAGSALVYSTYLGGTAGDEARGVAIDSSGNAYIVGKTSSTDYPTVNAFQSTFGGETPPFGDAFITKISDTTSGPASQVAFTQTAPVVQEDMTSLTLTVQRTGDTSGAVTVNYATADGTASERRDYTTALGTLQFAAGETAKTIFLLVNEDSFVEGNETFTVSLSNPTGGATLSCLTAVATVQITDDVSEPATNVIDDPAIFVSQQYHDLLVREPEAGGLQFYQDFLNGCQSTDTECIKFRRGAISVNFFRSPEFMQKGSFVMYLYMITLGQRPATAAELSDSTKIERPHYREFMADLQAISDPNDTKAIVSARKDALTIAWLQRPEIQSIFGALTNEQFVKKLESTAGVTLANESTLIADLNNFTRTRAQVLRAVAESPEVNAKFFMQAFVTMEYFGYLRREPEPCIGNPNPNQCGYIFHLNGFNSISDPALRENFIVRGFIESPEYRQRFGP